MTKGLDQFKTKAGRPAVLSNAILRVVDRPVTTGDVVTFLKFKEGIEAQSVAKPEMEKHARNVATMLARLANRGAIKRLDVRVGNQIWGPV